MQPSLRRKFSPELFSAAAASFNMKPTTSTARKGGNLSIFVVVLSIFLFGFFMYNDDVKSIAEFPFSRPKAQEIQEIKSNTFQENERNVKIGGKTTTFSVVMNARTVVETEVESAGAVVSDDEQNQENLKSGRGKKEEEEVKNNNIEMPIEEEDEEEEEIEIPPEDCDLYTGQWVFDNSTHPIYREDQCEFLTAQVTCMGNGRQDSLYQHWRWQPRDCSLPK